MTPPCQSVDARWCVELREGLDLERGPGTSCLSLEREIFIDNLLVRVHLIIEMSRPALRHRSLNSLFQVALYLPSIIVCRGPSRPAGAQRSRGLLRKESQDDALAAFRSFRF